MNSIRTIIENTFAAVAFAEAGERNETLALAGLEDVSGRSEWTLENVFAAVGMAEWGQDRAALEMVGVGRRPVRNNASLSDFLLNVGLANVPIRYGLARI